jgi:hypothetical protein
MGLDGAEGGEQVGGHGGTTLDGPSLTRNEQLSAVGVQHGSTRSATAPAATTGVAGRPTPPYTMIILPH